MRKIGFFLSFCLFVLFFPDVLHGRLGVGIGTGKIQVDTLMKPGIIYEIPSIAVINTGDEAANYMATVTYHQDQKELRPEKGWFDFSPREFRLEPGELKQVNINIDLPLKVTPGDYFAYLEARPVNTVSQGQTQVGIAAAAKLYFTVVPANVLQGVYYKAISLWKVYAPWPQRAAVVLGLIILFAIAKKFLHIEVKKSKKVTSQQASENE